MPRTIESLTQVVRGIYPPGKLGVVPRLVVRDPLEESLYPNTLCPKLRRFDRAFAEAAARAHNDSLAPLDAKIGHLVGG
jgi:acid phosphatase